MWQDVFCAIARKVRQGRWHAISEAGTTVARYIARSKDLAFSIVLVRQPEILDDKIADRRVEEAGEINFARPTRLRVPSSIVGKPSIRSGLTTIP